MATEIEEIKGKVDIVELISKYVPLKKRGRHYFACCPFHSEKTPSFIVSPELQIFKCFGCGKSGDIFTFLEEYDHVTFPEALEDLAAMAGIKLQKSQQFTAEEKLQKRLITLNQEVARFYNYILLKHPLGKPALDYVLGRGVTPESIRQFGIGYSPQNSALIINYLRKKGFSYDDMIASGTFGNSQYGNRYYDRFQTRLVFPLTDYRDRILGFSGRIMPNAANPNLAKYINSPETPIYHKSQMLFGLNLAHDAIRTQNSVIVVEGEFDMISPFQIGVKNIVALKGTAFTQEQLQLLRRYTDTLILGLDSDFAGNNAARKSIEMADSMGFEILVLILGGNYKDPDEAVKADPGQFKANLSSTVPVWEFIIQSSLKANDTDTIKGKKEFISTVMPFIAKISNPVIRFDYLRKISAILGSDEEIILNEAKKYAASLPPKGNSSPAAVSSTNNQTFMPLHNDVPVLELPTQKYEEELLILLLGARKPGLLAQKLKDHLELIRTPRFLAIIKELLEAHDFDSAVFQSRLAPEIQPTFQTLYLKSSQQELESKDRSTQIKKTVVRLNSLVIKERINEITQKIAQAEINDDETAINTLELEYNRLIAKLSQFQTKDP
ncbi:MAG TPA: DNA primase [Patescibacteria group bacterium]